MLAREGRRFSLPLLNLTANLPPSPVLLSLSLPSVLRRPPSPPEDYEYDSSGESTPSTPCTPPTAVLTNTQETNTGLPQEYAAGSPTSPASAASQLSQKGKEEGEPEDASPPPESHLCSRHQKLRQVEYLEQDPSGAWICRESSECKLSSRERKLSGKLHGTAAATATTPAPAQAPAVAPAAASSAGPSPRARPADSPAATTPARTPEPCFPGGATHPSPSNSTPGPRPTPLLNCHTLSLSSLSPSSTGRGQQHSPPTLVPGKEVCNAPVAGSATGAPVGRGHPRPWHPSSSPSPSPSPGGPQRCGSSSSTSGGGG
eukprot:RCo024846